jgi:dynein light intermediate chain 1
VLVPAGWDSWGKLAVLRDGFDARAWGAAWDADVAAAAAAAEPDEPGARRLYAELVPDESVKVRARP